MKSREKFAQEVAETIKTEHSKNVSESFIFGISGKWGEGKTFFLQQLEAKLGGFEVIKINPWKYASDRTSFLRYFLGELRNLELEIEKIETVSLKNLFINPNLKYLRKYLENLKSKLQVKTTYYRDLINNKDKYKKLNYDTQEKKIHWGLLLIIILYSILFCIVYLRGNILIENTLLISKPFHDFIVANSKLIVGLFLSIGLSSFIPWISQVVTTQLSSKSISTIDQFDDLLTEILKKLGKYKIVVFVDDLDRITPQKARDVLDNLRTFFDREELTFVVTGDHTVLERYIGTQTLPNKSEPDQLDEGRRFLKKIFNVYWRLPSLINVEFDTFLQGKFTEYNDDLSSIFEQESDKIIFGNYLTRYFEKNLRQVIRFLDSVIFTFKIIRLQLDNAEEKDKAYFKDLIKHPLLVIRILMIQELCAPLFEEILRDYNILFDLEYFVEKKDTSKIQGIIDRYASSLSSTQKSFIGKFLYEEPRFFKDSSLTVLSIEPFLFLAADASFGDARGLSSEDFVSLLKVGDPDQLKNSLLNSGDKKISNAASATMNLFQDPTSIADKNNYLKTLLGSLLVIPQHSAQKIFLDELKKLDLKYLQELTSPERMEVNSLFWKWLDIQKDIQSLEEFIDKFPFVNVEDFNYFNPEPSGQFISMVVSRWFLNYYPQNNVEALNKMEVILSKLAIDVVRENLLNLSEPLINDLINDGNIDLRNRRLEIITKYIKTGKENLRNKIFNGIKELGSEELWQWSLQKADGELSLWSRKELEQQLINKLKEATDSTHVLNLLQFGNNKITALSLKELWNYLLGTGTQVTLFMQIIPNTINDSSLASISPDIIHAKLLFRAIVKKIMDLGNDDERAIWVAHLDKHKWFWFNLDQIPERKNLEKLLSSENENLRNTVQQTIDTWSQK